MCIKLARASAATCFPGLLSGVVNEHRFVLMFGCFAWSWVGDVFFNLVQGDVEAWSGHIGGF